MHRAECWQAPFLQIPLKTQPAWDSAEVLSNQLVQLSKMFPLNLDAPKIPALHNLGILPILNEKVATPVAVVV